MFDNIILLTDSYKVSHAVQYPSGTKYVYSYFESRGGEFDSVVFAGLQYFIKRYLEGSVVTKDKIDQAERLLTKHLGPGVFNRAKWEYILEKHSGHLPIRILAVPEGTVVPVKNVMMTVENTDPNCWWLTNYLETLLVQVWYPSTVATISRQMKKMIKAGLDRTGTLGGLEYKLHDFGYRGVSSVESAGLGGFGHLINFQGTDTMAALEVAQEYYNLEATEVAGVSIPASEHSTITSWGKEGELAAYKNMLDQYPKGLVACVSDSWDIFNACKHLWGRELKKQIMQREGTLVIRPDSGDPKEVLPQLLSILDLEFGATTNDKNYKVLPQQVRVIQGDGIRRETLQGILNAVMDAGYSIDNLAFGSGGGLLQDCNRDTQKFAFKCSQVHGEYGTRDVYKQPVGDTWKKSKRGRLALVKHDLFETINGTGWATVPMSEAKNFGGDQLNLVFADGKVIQTYGLRDIRDRAKL